MFTHRAGYTALEHRHPSGSRKTRGPLVSPVLRAKPFDLLFRNGTHRSSRALAFAGKKAMSRQEILGWDETGCRSDEKTLLTDFVIEEFEEEGSSGQTVRAS